MPKRGGGVGFTVRIRAIAAFVLLVALISLLNVPAFWKTVYPIYYYPMIQRESRAVNVNPLLVAALVRVESHFQEDDVSHAGAVGLMQLMPQTASWAAGEIGMKLRGPIDLSEPTLNVRLGSWYIAYLIKLFHGQLPEAIAAYNAGPNRVEHWLKDGAWSGDEVALADIPVRETRHFVARVLYTYQIFRRFY